MVYEPSENFDGKRPLPARPANKTNKEDYQKSTEQGEQKDSDNGNR